MTRWAVIYRRGRVLDVWAVVVDVPIEVSKNEVMAAIEQWRLWPAWQARMTLGGKVDVSHERRWGSAIASRISTAVDLADADMPLTHTISWEQLKPETRAITVQVSSEVHAMLRTWAATRGISLAELVRELLSQPVGL